MAPTPRAAPLTPGSAGRVLLTGSARGTGRGIAREFHDRGWTVASLNRSLAGEPWLGEVACDLRDPDAVEAACRQALRRLGGVDVVVANAAVRRFGPVEELSREHWVESIETNLTAVFLLCRETLAALRESHGHLVIIGSQAADEPFEGGAAYCATKLALRALADVVRLEARPDVRVTLVTPTAIRNRAVDDDATKLSPGAVGAVVYSLVTAPAEILPTEVRVESRFMRKSALHGIERLQSY